MKTQKVIISITIICILILLAIGLYFFQLEKNTQQSSAKIEIVKAEIEPNEKITQEGAKQLAIMQFQKIGEKIDASELKIRTITREGEEYYYLTSKKNTIEIKVQGGMITRLNAATIEEED